MTLVTLHRPGSANAAASACLYREQERALRCQPLFRPRPTAGLWSPMPGVWGLSVTASPRCSPHLHFDRCATAPETWLLPAVSRAPICPRCQPIVQQHSMEGARWFPGPSSGYRSAIALPQSHSLCSPPLRLFCEVLGVPPPAMSIICRRRWGLGIGREQRRGPAGDRLPLRAPAGDPTLIAPVKVRTRMKLRVSIETQELRLSTRECDFPWINIPSIVVAWYAYKWHPPFRTSSVVQ